MSHMMTVNKKVACTPFVTTQTKVEVKGGLPHLKQKQELTKLRIVYDTAEDSDFYEGDYVLVKGETFKHQWAKEVFEIEEGKPFILIPFDMIQGVVDAEE